MSDIPSRLYQIGKAYLDAAKDRLSEIDTHAQAELDRAMTHDDMKAGLSASSDPMERARAKIAAARRDMAAQLETGTRRDPLVESPLAEGLTAPPPPPDPVQTARKILGVAPDANFGAVQTAVLTLRERCAPSRFPDGSQEQAEARIILERVEDAFRVLREALQPEAGRFDRLEI